MNTRRNFLGKAAVAAGMSFCGCNLFGARAARAAPARLPVTVNGKRVKTIDVHSHCMFHEANNLPGPEAAARLEPHINGAKEVFIAVSGRLKAMDSQAVDMEVAVGQPVLVHHGGTLQWNDCVAPSPATVSVAVSRTSPPSKTTCTDRAMPACVSGRAGSLIVPRTPEHKAFRAG
jgi:hypothetical protein